MAVRHDALRRYPALGFLGVAALLAVALPSALTVPNAGPPTLAEFAPVPGQGQGTGGDLGRLGSGSSGDLGAGPGGLLPQGPGGGPGQPAADLKRCVGDPPRQTEDPLSPPCVAFFDGDNGGATAPGVTRDEVRVALLLQDFADGHEPGDWVDLAEPIGPDDDDQDVWLKTYARYFNERYQTYGRSVHLYGLYTVGGSQRAGLVERRRAEAGRIHDERAPFATGTLVFDAVVPFLDEAADRGMLSVAVDGFERRFYADRSPLLWGVFPDLEDEAALTAGYACRRLAGRPARYSGNPTDQSRERVFGIVYSESEREPANARLAVILERELKRRCGIEVAASVGASDAIQDAQGEAPQGIAALRTAGVTTVILPARNQTILAFTAAASASGWFPEWFIPGRRSMTGIDQAANGRLIPQEQWQHAFGISYSSRWGGAADTHWLRSYQETCGGCAVRGPYYFGAYAYDTLQMLFYGIQAAGPRLTPERFDQGMHAIPPRASVDPFTPAAYFSPRNFSYVKDAMEIWWDPSGQAPGSEGATGCYRVPREGRRFRAGEWPPGDDGLFRDGPCNGDAPVA